MPSDLLDDRAEGRPESRFVRLRFPSEPMAVRGALRSLLAARQLSLLGEDDRGTAEIVLAEALNNIVEHAYALRRGDIEVTIRVATGSLICTICDHGLPMPGETPPAGRLPEALSLDDLPEGGFGWHMIRSLSRDLAYQRIEGRNELTFRLLTGTD
jgi:serine/threonine-protein kinase RsbW